MNQPKTRASAQAVPVIRQLAEILNDYRASIGNPRDGVMFHQGESQPLDLDKLAQRVLRHAKPHVTKDRYIQAFDPAVLAAMKSLETRLDALDECAAIVQQVN